MSEHEPARSWQSALRQLADTLAPGANIEIDPADPEASCARIAESAQKEGAVLKALLRAVYSWMEWSMPFDESNAQMRLRRELYRILGAADPSLEVIELAEERGRDLTEATIAMAVARLGGMVEGRPTERVNFLQRIDELREIERRTEEVESPAVSELRDKEVHGE